MSLTAWKHVFLEHLSTNKTPSARWPQLATVGLNGAPQVRTIAFRGFLDSYDDLCREDASTALCFITDARSTKAEEIQRNSSIQLCWYLEESRVQYRISGNASIVHPSARNPHSTSLTEYYSDALNQSHIRTALWRRMSSETRAQFLWPLAKDWSVETAQLSGLPTALELSHSQAENAFENFAVLIVEPTVIELLDLKKVPFALERFTV